MCQTFESLDEDFKAIASIYFRREDAEESLMHWLCEDYKGDYRVAQIKIKVKE